MSWQMVVAGLRAVPFLPPGNPSLAPIKRFQTLRICINYECGKGPMRRKQLRGWPTRIGAHGLGHPRCTPGEPDRCRRVVVGNVREEPEQRGYISRGLNNEG